MRYLRSFAFTFFLFFINYLSSQTVSLNIQQVAHVPISSLIVPSELNDIWGWVDSSGNEYAIVGTNDGTSIFDLSDPVNPLEVLFVPGMSSIWRDIKTYGNYAYVTTEAQNGLLIIDLSNLPDSTNTNTYLYTGPSIASWQSAHNLYIDDRGYAYIFGANRGNKGAIILDLNQDPTNPVEIADINNWYVHDGMVKGDTLFLAHASNSFFTIWDVSNPTNPTLLGQNPTVGFYSHNIWSSDDGEYIYTTEEDNGGHLSEFKITDFNNIDLTDKIQAEPGNNIMPHNAFYLNDYIINSYYTTGLQLFDVKSKGNIVNVGHFDTSPNFSGPNSNGCWGVYPYLPSGLIIASDIEAGFYVLNPDYKRAAYLEGVITDASNNAQLSGVNVEILNNNNNTTLSKVGGSYKMGTLNSGTYSIVFSHPLYQSDTINQVVLQNDSTTVLDIGLFSLSPLNLNIETKLSSQNNPLSNVSFIISNDNFSYSGITNQNGQFTVNNLIPGSYNIYAGIWGFQDFCLENFTIVDDTSPFVMSFEEGYQDPFNIDLGWAINSSAASGNWVRDKPVLTSFNNIPCNPGSDSYDCGEMAFITGNSGGSFTSDDVDLGYVKLTSSTISLNVNESHYLHCNVWWKNIAGASTPDDTLFIRANDGQNVVNLLTATHLDEFEWVSKTFQLPSSIDLSNFQIEVYTADWSIGIDNVVEAGIDNFHITNNPLGDNSIEGENNPIVVYPNPTADGWIHIKGFEDNFTYQVYSLTGKLILVGDQSSFQIENPGMYVLRIKSGEKMILKKIIF